jgi:hypothetical protein
LLALTAMHEAHYCIEGRLGLLDRLAMCASPERSSVCGESVRTNFLRKVPAPARPLHGGLAARATSSLASVIDWWVADSTRLRSKVCKLSSLEALGDFATEAPGLNEPGVREKASTPGALRTWVATAHWRAIRTQAVTCISAAARRIGRTEGRTIAVEIAGVDGLYFHPTL